MYTVNLTPNTLSIEVVSPQRADRYLIFYDIGQGLNRADSMSASVRPDSKIIDVVFFGFPVKHIKTFRIDPGRSVGKIEIKAIKLSHEFRRLGFQFPFPLYRLSGKKLLQDFYPGNDISDFSSNGSLLQITSIGRNPYFKYRGDWCAVQTAITANMIHFKVLLFCVVNVAFALTVFEILHPTISTLAMFVVSACRSFVKSPPPPVKSYYLLILLDIILLGVITLSPKFVLGSDGHYYVAIANNIMHFGKFFNSLPGSTFPIGFPLILAPATIFRNNTARFIFLYAISAGFINILWFAANTFLKKFYSPGTAGIASTILCLTPGVLFPGFLRFNSETVYTVLICCSFIVLYHALTEHRHAYWWGLTSFLVCLSYTVRTISIALIFSFIVVLIFQLIKSPGKSFSYLLASFVGGALGLIPIFLQALSLLYHDPDVFLPQYSASLGFYLRHLTSSFVNMKEFMLLIEAFWHQSALVLVLTLGGCIVFLFYIKRLLLYSLRSFKKDALFIQLFTFVLVFCILQFGQSILHVKGHYLADRGVFDANSRYLLPISSLILLCCFVLTKKYPEILRDVNRQRMHILLFIGGFDVILLFFFQIQNPKRYTFYSMEKIITWLHVPGNSVLYIAIALPALFLILWCKKKPAQVDYVMFLFVALCLFLSSFVVYAFDRSAIGARRTRAKFRIESAFYEHSIFENKGIRTIYLLYPARIEKKKKDIFRQYAHINFKKNYIYTGMTYNEFLHLNDKKREHVIAFAGKQANLPCHILKQGKYLDLYYCGSALHAGELEEMTGIKNYSGSH